LQRAAGNRIPVQFRWFFAINYIFCPPLNIFYLWETFKEALSEEFRKDHQSEISCSLTLKELEIIFKQHGNNWNQFYPPRPPSNIRPMIIAYDANKERQNGEEIYHKLNHEQKTVVDEVLNSVRNQLPNCYFIDGPGASGKTFIYKTLCHIL